MDKKCLRSWVLWLAVLLLVPGMAMAGEDTDVSIYSVVTQAPQEVQEQQTVPAATAAPDETPQITPASQGAREELIDRMLALAKKLSDEAGGRPRRAHYAGDIYVCKNFTVHIFRENAGDFEMAEYPGVKLVIPNNLPRAESRPLAYGIFWQDVPADKGNPFYAAHTFAYDTNLSKEENRARAMDMMRQVQRGDFFQMSANYAYGVGAHSLVFTQDYDPDTNQVTWTDSNMNGLTRNGERYGYVQFDAKKDIGWFVDAFCQRTRGATIYRLRENIVKK
ncbi:MAG: hypothetical protein ACOX7B_15520 [Christensenellales bacterium]|jgi:hypothetical protein